MKNIRTFIVCSSMLLLAWLGVSYTTDQSNTGAGSAAKVSTKAPNKALNQVSLDTANTSANTPPGKVSPAQQQDHTVITASNFSSE